MPFHEVLYSVAFALVRFGSFTAHAIVFGTVAIVVLVLRPAFAGVEAEGWAAGRLRVAARLEGVVQSALVASVVATVSGIVLQAALVSAADPSGISYRSFDAVLGTTFGQWYALRLPLVAGLFVLLSSRIRSWALPGLPRRTAGGTVWLGVWAGLALVLLATSTFSGHAAVAQPRAAALVNDIVHLAAGSVWFAGIVILTVVLPEGWVGRTGRDRLRLLAPSVVRFSQVALVAIAVVAITGTINSLLHVAALDDLADSGYGRSLLTKIILFVGILALGGFNHFVLRRRLEAAAGVEDARSAARVFRRSVGAELAVAIAIIGMTAVMTGQARTRPAEIPADVSSSRTP